MDQIRLSTAHAQKRLLLEHEGIGAPDFTFPDHALALIP
jgi:hypothetical protein